MTAAVHEQDDAAERPEINMRQQPVTQSTHAPAIHLLSTRIGYRTRDSHQTHQPGYPTHRQPGSAQVLPESVMQDRPANHAGDGYRHQDTADVPEPGDRIAF